MRAQLFITSRVTPLDNWREAFPELTLLEDPTLARPPAPRSTLLWLHPTPGAEALPSRVEGLRRWAPECPLVVLANRPTEAEGLLALEAGASGYLSSLAAPSVLLQVAEVVTQGGTWVGQDLMQRLLTRLARHDGQHDAQALHKLTARERAVALGVAAGDSNKEIARRLGISERTVKFHLSAIFQLLGVRDRLQLAVLVNGIPAWRDAA